MKKIMIISLLGTLLFLSLNSKAQFEDINLNTYKLTDYKYITLGSRLNASNNGSYNSKSSNGDYAYNSTSNKNYIIGGSNLDFSSTVYNKKYSGYQMVSFEFNTDYGKGSNDYSVHNSWNNYQSSYKTSRNNSNVQLFVLSKNRFYLSSDFFLGVSINSTQTSSNSYSKINSDSDEYRQLFNLFGSRNTGGLQFGKGRIENVTDARLSIYILDDLLKQGRLLRTPSEDEVFEFADFVTKTLNKRIIDSRIKTIKEYVAIDSFLVSNGLSSKTDGLYFGLINDNWNYARSQVWNTGSEWYIGTSPFISYENIFIKQTGVFVTKTRDELSMYGVSFNAGFRSSWISGLKWQKGYSIDGSFNIFKCDTVGNHFTGYRDFNSFEGNARYYVSYIPNTRTTITGETSVVFTKYLSDDVSNALIIMSTISGSCNYYFSEKLRLSVSANVYHNFSKEYDPTLTDKSIGYILGATLYYYIF